jgi:glycosyltransferase involved in cell wall biosynthesis
MEAMAMGKAIVSTKKGAEGLDVSNCGIILTDTIEEFTQSVLKLAADPQQRHHYGQMNHAYAKDHFDWEKIFENTALPLYHF